MVRDGIQNAGHLLCTKWVFNNHATAHQCALHCLNDLVKRRCGSTLLFKANQAEVGLVAVLKDSVEFSSELNLPKLED